MTREQDIRIPVDEAEREAIESMADDTGVSVASLLRALAMERATGRGITIAGHPMPADMLEHVRRAIEGRGERATSEALYGFVYAAVGEAMSRELGQQALRREEEREREARRAGA
jgi:hypothetical protein